MVQRWVTHALHGGLSARSAVRHHVVLHGILGRAVRDRVIAHNPATDTGLPKVIAKRQRIIAPTSSSGCSCSPCRGAQAVPGQLSA